MNMFDIALSGLLADLWQDLQHPDIVWQALILLSALCCGKLAERVVQNRHYEDMRMAVQLGHRGLKRLVFPLVALLLVLIAREIVRPILHVQLLSLAVPLLLSLAAIRSVFFVLRVTFSNTPVLRNFERVFSTIVWLVVALHITGFLPELINLLEAVQFSIGKQKLDVWQVLQGFMVVAMALLISLWLGSLIEVRLMSADGLDNNLQVVFSRLAKAVLVLLAIMVALPSVGIDLTALSVFGGALGVGLGLGLQKIASNYVSGFIILLDRSIRIGNVIAVGADKGKVTQITTRYTVLRAGNGVESLVPNESLISNAVQNETYSDYRVRHVLPIQISYHDDPEQAMSILVSEAKAHPQVAIEPEPQAFLTLFADSGVNLELLYWLDEPEVNSMKVRSDINLAIFKAFADAGINIPFPQREIRMLNPAEEKDSA